MLEQLKTKLQQEETQREVLKFVGFVGVFIASRIVTNVMNKGVEAGIEALMSKLHPTEEVTTEEVSA